MLLQRVITALILLVAVITAFTLTSPWVFSIVIGATVLVAAFEWTGFIGLSTLKNKISYIASILIILLGLGFMFNISPDINQLDPVRVLTVMALGAIFWAGVIFLILGYPGNVSSWNEQSIIALMGVFVLVPTWSGLVQLKFLDPSGLLLISLICVVSAADVGAYFTGRAWGKKKLAPDLSPNKSWAGVWGGIAASVIVAVVLLIIASRNGIELSAMQSVFLVIGSGIIAILSVIGDLFESMLKRNRQMKDSGKILPGHGGILDRCDSLTAVIPPGVFLVMLVFTERWSL